MRPFDDPASFRDKFYRQLQLKINQDPYFAAAADEDEIMPPASAHIGLSGEAQALIKAASQSRHGIINRMLSMGRPLISTNGIGFVNMDDPRSIATWEAAVEELERAGLIEAMNLNRDGLRVTRRGYEVAETIPA